MAAATFIEPAEKSSFTGQRLELLATQTQIGEEAQISGESEVPWNTG